MHGGEKEEEEEWISRAADRKTGIQREGAKTLRSEGTAEESRGNAKGKGGMYVPGEIYYKYSGKGDGREKHMWDVIWEWAAGGRGLQKV